ncbi:MAG: glutathione S-transferase family protein [Congregibacter sp.]
MHLYTFDSAPNPRRVGLFLLYKDVQLPTTQIDMRQNEHRADAFLAINPMGTLPALQTEEDVLLTEVIAICDYLDAHYPDKPLMGCSVLERALVLAWDHRIFVSLFEPFAEMLRNRSPAFENRALPGPVDIEQIPALEARGRKRFRATLEQIELEIGDNSFLCGEQLTLADIDLLVAVETARWVKEELPASSTRLQAWAERTRAALA